MSTKEAKIYVAQTHLTLELDCDSDLSDADIITIKYIRPDDTTDVWTTNITFNAAAVEGDDDYGIVIRTGFEVGDLDQAGGWIIWAYVLYNDSSVAPGEPDFMEVYEEGK